MDAKCQTLDRIIDVFSSGSRDSLFEIGPYSGLIGKEVLKEEIKQEKGFEVQLQYKDLYSNLKLDASFIPANVMGRILTDQKVNQIIARRSLHSPLATLTRAFSARPYEPPDPNPHIARSLLLRAA